MDNEVLDVARIEARALHLTLVDLALAPAVTGVLDMVAPLAAAAERVTLHATPSPAHVHVHADERRVTQVLLNLMMNAIRDNRADGAAFVGWTIDTRHVLVAVRDTGPGIAHEHMDRLFTPIDRLGRSSGEGVGLALPLADA